MKIPRVLRAAGPVVIGITYYLGIAGLLGRLGVDEPPPEKPAFRIAGYALPAPAAKAPSPTPPPARRPTVPMAAHNARAPVMRPSPKPAPLQKAANTAQAESEQTVPAAAQAQPDAPPPPEDGPLAPSDIAPGGSTLVLAVHIDDQGTVLKTKILVPSRDIVANLTYGLALQSAKGLNLNLNPPLQPGETRWLVVPIRFRDGQDVLP